MIKFSCFLLLSIGVILLPGQVTAQGKGYKFDKKQRVNYTAYPSPNDFRQYGWLFDAGLTGTIGTNAPTETTLGDTSFSYPYQIRPGITLKIGGYYNLDKFRKVIRYIDANLGYKLLWNTEKRDYQTNTTTATGSDLNNNLAHYANLDINFNNVINLSNFTFIQNTIGFNFDYRFLENLSVTYPTATNSPPNFIAQAHYKLGFGIMIDNDIAIIPYLEVPLFNLSPNQSQFSQLDYFNQSFQSAIIGVRIMLFRFGQRDCPKAINTEGKARNNGY